MKYVNYLSNDTLFISYMFCTIIVKKYVVIIS